MRKWMSLLTALTLLLAAAMPVFAHEVPDPEQPGSITFALEWEGEPLDSGSLTIYRVGDIAQDDGNYSFTPVEALQNADISLEQPNDPALAQRLAELARELALEGVTVPITDGKAVFDQVLPGLYVVCQDAETASDGFAPLAPFTISLPQWVDEGYVYEISARPKVGLEAAPTEPSEPTEPTEPDDPDLPYTGQLEWPIPVMAVCGLALFMMGWFLCFRKRDSHA